MMCDVINTICFKYNFIWRKNRLIIIIVFKIIYVLTYIHTHMNIYKLLLEKNKCPEM